MISVAGRLAATGHVGRRNATTGAECSTGAARGRPAESAPPADFTIMYARRMIFPGRTRPGRRALAGSTALAGLAVAAVVAGLVMIEPVPTGGDSAFVGGVEVAPTAVPTRAASPSPSPTPTPARPVASALVPVVSFWSTRRDISRADVAALWDGQPGAAVRTGFTRLLAPAGDEAELRAVFGAAHATAVSFQSPGQIKEAVKASAATLGLIPAEDVTPDVLALSMDGVSLFDSERIDDVTAWPLDVLSMTPSSFDPASVWTLAAGGDVNLAREVYVMSVTRQRGPDYPWSAGYAVIHGHDCCTVTGGPLLAAQPTGPGGALRSLLSDANLAVVNLEGPAPDSYVNSRDSLNFTFDPALLKGLKDAGIDAVSLANNHIKNGGATGVVQTCQNLDAIGLAHAGAGATATAARQPVWLSADGLKIAFLAYSAVGTQNWASATTPGAAPLRLADVQADIRAARANGANIVIVMPHWGEEYSYALNATQKGDAAAFVAAGADLVLGSHSHWVGGIESIPGPDGPAFIEYSLGDFLFDLNHDTESQEGVLETMTFSGTRLVQVSLQPTIMISGARVGLLSPAGDGKTVLDAIHKASRRLPGF